MFSIKQSVCLFKLFWATVPTQIRIDEELKKQAVDLFAQLGLHMSSAINMFLKQCILRGGLPFNVELPNYKADVIEAMEEANTRYEFEPANWE